MVRRVQVAAIWLILTGVATCLFLFDPAKGGYPPCPFRMLTGLQCPGCGSTRSAYQLLHGHPIAAFELNPLLIISLPIILYGLVSVTKSAIMDHQMQAILIPQRYAWVFLFVVIGFWVFRNTSFYPFVS